MERNNEVATNTLSRLDSNVVVSCCVESVVVDGGRMEAFRGKAPGNGAGDISRRTAAMRPPLGLDVKQAATARGLRRQGFEPDWIADHMALPRDEVEKALMQMRMPRPETTRGTLNVTLAAHRLVLGERIGDEPLWRTVDRMIDELLRFRQAAKQDAIQQKRIRTRPAATAAQGDLLELAD
jgi:hypothetical protein